MDTYTLAATEFAGFEQEILRLRNSARSNPQTLGYVNWRYRVASGVPAPTIFWIRSASGLAVGMCSLIFRLYWIDGRRCNIAVLGDISLDAACRGRGLGQKLLGFVNQYLNDQHPDCLAFVLPNDAARKSLRAVGWMVREKLYPCVFMLNPGAKLSGVLGKSRFSESVAKILGKAMHRILRLHIDDAHSLHILPLPDDSMQQLWQKTSKHGTVLRDIGTESLAWRYVDHPSHTFSFAKVTCENRLIAYLVFKISAAERTCAIYDLLVGDSRDLRPVMALFIAHCYGLNTIDTVRILLNKRHPYRPKLSLLGFISRSPAGDFQTYASRPQDRTNACRWAITWGDKDI